MLAEIWLLWPFPLGWFWFLLIMRGPETGLRRLAVRTLVNIAGFVLEGVNGLIVVIALGQRMWRTCGMRPHSRRQLAAAWRCQRLKQVQSALLDVAAKSSIDLASSSAALAAAEANVDLISGQHIKLASTYLGTLSAAQARAEAGLHALFQLVRLWRDVLSLPAPKLHCVCEEFIRRHPLREVTAAEAEHARSDGQWSDVSSRRLLLTIRQSMRGKVQDSSRRVEWDGSAIVLRAHFYGGPSFIFVINAMLPGGTVRYILQEARRFEKAGRLTPYDDQVDRLVRAVQHLAATEFSRFEFDKLAIAVYDLHNAEAKHARGEAALHDAILSTILLHRELERRTVELRHAFFDFDRGCEHDVELGAGSLRRSA
ncbi:hypothetical protein BJY59DRAFT_721870 [Rhodotorula toruloides]